MPRTAARSAGRRRTATAPVATDDIAKACWAGGTIQIYVNPNRIKNAAQASSASFPTYEEVRTAVRTAFQNLTDPAHPGKQVVLKILNKEELRNVDGSDSLHPNRSGDVVVVLRAPYQSDAGTAGQAVALSHFFGQHGYLPNTVDIKNNINMHAVFVIGGPLIKKQGQRQGSPGDRRRSDDRVPDGHPRAAERPRADPLRRDRAHGGAP